jgi:hypothetical protein
MRGKVSAKSAKRRSGKPKEKGCVKKFQGPGMQQTVGGTVAQGYELVARLLRM